MALPVQPQTKFSLNIECYVAPFYQQAVPTVSMDASCCLVLKGTITILLEHTIDNKVSPQLFMPGGALSLYISVCIHVNLLGDIHSE